MKVSEIKTIFTATALLLLLPARVVHPAFEDNSSPGVMLSAMEKLIPNLTTPPVTFTIRNDITQTDLFFGLKEDELSGILAWQIQILDQTGRKVSFIQGTDRPPSAAIPWAGTATSGAALPDGFYKARFSWIGSDKQVHTTPKITVSLSTPLEIRRLAGRKLLFNYTDEGLVVSITEGMIFTSGQSEIQPKAVPALQEISLFLKSYSKNLVTIRGYTDSSGSVQVNMALSARRAASVYTYLLNAGIDPRCLTYKGLGSSQPIAANTTEAGRARNRRVDVIVLKNTI